MPPRRLPHGYTNRSWVEDGQVVKEYNAVDGAERLRVEVAALGRSAGVVPVPEVVSVDLGRRRAVLTVMPGRHGQELVDAGFAAPVLAAAGRTLRALHRSLPGLVHGDYGPQNLLFDVTAWEVSAVLDWEFAREGDPVEDLAWAEWIVRTHHPDDVGALPALFAGYGSRPPWPDRQEAMLRRCAELEELCHRRGQAQGAALWDRRQHATRAWSG
ncbi:phosphotransferase [Friedmanniella luteola]|uniref:phosphotransferase n=1 Tax=Friedmanniella luteola TaxID=546871 RepID=UPI0012FD3344|nr:phosphotransferase [Friedmanniella luteola]